MSEWKAIAHFLYGKGFWYADPLREIDGLTEERLFWVPDPNSLCILWHVGHIAHRERTHIGRFLQGFKESIIPPQFDVFGTEWSSVERIRQSVDSVTSVLAWMREVREKSHEYIASLNDRDFSSVPPTSEEGLSVAHWLFITSAHTALHIGRIQLLRALIEGKPERAC
ncbi:MAG: hypothetical protein AMJ73_03230 [candidate division Zixibacteria bacterium SM1_73]|nr:MAG: hypothetical protein AMJ73_03230 [candidate division Zixibacteria bacterium SM1_73]